MSFSNKVVIVTGGSSGIGASTAISFAREGADVTIVGRNDKKLLEIGEKITNIGKKPLIIKADVSNDQELRTIVKKTVDKYGKLDVLVNNAGMVKMATVMDTNLPQVYDEVMNTNLRSAVLLTNWAAPYLIKTKGNIVNISSVAGSSPLAGIGSIGYSVYCTSKAGMDHFSRVAALELSEKGVRVNLVSPGPVDTPIIGSMAEPNWDAIANTTALKRVTRPEEIADLILYLASDKARSITGSNYTIDSGMKLKM